MVEVGDGELEKRDDTSHGQEGHGVTDRGTPDRGAGSPSPPAGRWNR